MNGCFVFCLDFMLLGEFIHASSMNEFISKEKFSVLRSQRHFQSLCIVQDFCTDGAFFNNLVVKEK